MEYLGKDVVWDGNTSTVYINDREEGWRGRRGFLRVAVRIY